MRLLAIQASGVGEGVAAAIDRNVLAELKLDDQVRSAQSLAPAIKSLLEGVGWRPADVQLVAVTVGPGSFTGLRVGVTTAKTFAYCVGAQIVGVDTLQTIAEGVAQRQAAGSPGLEAVEVLETAVDAQRGQVVAQRFRRGPDGHFVAAACAQLLDSEAWVKQLAPATFVAGPVLRSLCAKISGHVHVLPAEYWSPTAAGVVRVAMRSYEAGQRDDVWSLTPRYCRLSAAEERRQAGLL